jgi:hypothetical protein
MWQYTGNILFPPPMLRTHAVRAATDGFSITSQGYGSITGLTYTIPAHTDADFDVDLKVLALTSNDVQNLNNLIKGMVSASQYDKVDDYERTHASADVSFWGMLGGGGGASYEKTHHEMSGFGLSEENQRTIVSAMSEIAKNMSRVGVKIHVHNSANDYAVSGNMIVFTIAGTVVTQNQQSQYRMIAKQGVAGTGDQTAPTSNEIVPLN